MNMKKKNNYRQLVKKHYKQEAKTKGLSLTSTMHDIATREMEIRVIASYLKNGDTCLEVGCGNGAASVEISKIKKIHLTAVDFSTDLISLAKAQSKKGIKGEIHFAQKDVLTLKEKEVYDVVFTERCIINLLSPDDQRRALENMARALKKGGRLLLLEAFADGLTELNTARREIGLEPIPPAYHNLHLKRDDVVKFLAREDLRLAEENNFLSSYYFGSRVLYPALAKLGKKEVVYNSRFADFFRYLPPYGNYSHIKILFFRKK